MPFAIKLGRDSGSVPLQVTEESCAPCKVFVTCPSCSPPPPPTSEIRCSPPPPPTSEIRCSPPPTSEIMCSIPPTISSELWSFSPKLLFDPAYDQSHPQDQKQK